VLYKPISNVGNVKVLVVTLLTKVLGFPREWGVGKKKPILHKALTKDQISRPCF
jgi:hypothetical protein